MIRLRAWWRGRPRRRWFPCCGVSAWSTAAGQRRHQAAHRLLDEIRTYLRSTR
jgi:hypothetical protein